MRNEKSPQENEELVEVVKESSKQSLFSRLRKHRADRKSNRQAEIDKGLSAEENKIVEEKIEEVNKEIQESHTSTTRKKVWKSLFFILNIVLVIGVLIWDIFTSGENFSFGQIVNGWYLLIVFFFLALVVIIDVMSVHRLIYRKTLMSRCSIS